MTKIQPQETGKCGKKDVTRGQANSTGVPPDQKIDNAEELTYLSINIDIKSITKYQF